MIIDFLNFLFKCDKIANDFTNWQVVFTPLSKYIFAIIFSTMKHFLIFALNQFISYLGQNNLIL